MARSLARGSLVIVAHLPVHSAPCGERAAIGPMRDACDATHRRHVPSGDRDRGALPREAPVRAPAARPASEGKVGSLAMRFFVTGGAGFIGSNFIRRLLATDPDARVTNFDKLTYAGNLVSLVDVESDPRYEFVNGDICDEAAVAEALPGHDVVVNFAAESHVDRSIHGGVDAVTTNTVGVAVL